MTTRRGRVQRSVLNAVDRVQQGSGVLKIGGDRQPVHLESVEYLVENCLLLHNDDRVHTLIFSHVQLGQPQQPVLNIIVDTEERRQQQEQQPDEQGPAQQQRQEQQHVLVDPLIELIRPIANYIQDPRCSLHTLHLVGSRLGNDASKYLLEALENNSTIVDLDLNTNYMEDVGEALEQFLTTMTTTAAVTDTTLATSAKTNNRSHLQRLNLSYNWLTERSAHGLARGLRHNQQLMELNLHGCLLGEEGTRPILEQLAVAGTRNSAMATTQSSLSALRTLSLSLNFLNFSLLSLPLANLLRYNETLECLDLSSNPQLFGSTSEEEDTVQQQLMDDSDDSSSFVAQEREQQEQIWATIANGTEAFAQALASNTSLTSLSLNLCGLEAATVAPIFRALTINSSLKSLNVSQNMLGNDASWKTTTASSFVTMTTPRFTTATTPREVTTEPLLFACLPDMKGLRRLRLDSQPSPQLLQRNFSLFHVSLDGNAGTRKDGKRTNINYSTSSSSNRGSRGTTSLAKSATRTTNEGERDGANEIVTHILSRNRAVYHAQLLVERQPGCPQEKKGRDGDDDDEEGRQPCLPAKLVYHSDLLERMARYPAALHWILRFRLYEWMAASSSLSTRISAVPETPKHSMVGCKGH